MRTADDFPGCCDNTRPVIDEFIAHTKKSVVENSTHVHSNDSQTLRHGFAWQATLASGFHAIADWIARLEKANACGELELAVAHRACGGIVQQLLYGVEMSQLEVFRVSHHSAEWQRLSQCEPLFVSDHTTLLNDVFKHNLADNSCHTNIGLNEALTQVAQQFQTFSDKQIAPYAQQWHLDNALIPDDLVQQLGELGVFGLTIDERFGGSGFGKLAMCVVTEELSRGYIGVGSLSTRSEIAAELIQLSGTTEQKQQYLPLIASGQCLPSAVFTEPDTGSDLAALRCRATRDQFGNWQITGNKTWITHAARSDLMTLLVRTDADKPGYDGLSMLLIDKQRGSDSHPFPDHGISGTEIEVLGYRGMREYDIAFDHFQAPEGCVLGNTEGRGFKQLMTTFEAARIQTAARAVGVARSAFEQALKYSRERRQFGTPIQSYQRIYDKLIR
ncbi:MAG: acyl-CoA dehydrogenase family protein, partial [Pseudomonadota bacterium]